MLAGLCVAASGSVSAQQLNKGQTAMVQADSKIAQATAQANLVAAQRDGKKLNPKKLTDRAISTDCGVTQIGGQTTGQAQKPKSLVGSNLSGSGDAVTVTEDVIVLCRR
ncbi:hypothetical protein AS593_19730 [Caulobacter vibrioides]|nr:hypothetical protein AS593_19730 [Caulobacter vibrioides]